LETEIATLEARVAELTAVLENPATYDKSGNAMAVNREMHEVMDRLTQVTAEWEAAATKLHEMEQE
jgi:hypothetical protein